MFPHVQRRLLLAPPTPCYGTCLGSQRGGTTAPCRDRNEGARKEHEGKVRMKIEKVRRNFESWRGVITHPVKRVRGLDLEII